jgi:long-chain acyl-CoA synthetase
MPPQYHYSEFIGDERPGETRVIRSLGYRTDLMRTPEPNLNTLYLTQSTAFRKFASRPFLGTVHDGVYRFKTYNQIKESAMAIGSVLCDLVDEVTEGGKVYRFFGIYSANREEWATASIASTHYTLTSVSLYDTLGTEALEYILVQTGLKVVIVSQANYPKLLKQCQDRRAGQLRTFIMLDEINQTMVSEARSFGIDLLSWQDLIARGRNSPKPLRVPKSSDVFTISYTSGTTGNPKGAILTHGAMVASLAGISTHFRLVPDDVHLSFLPLAHIYERIVQESAIYSGASIGFWRGNILAIRDDLALLRPTVLPGVPRLWNRFADVIKGRLGEATGMKKSIIERAIKSKLEALHEDGKLTHSLYDKLVFNKIKEVIGGRVRYASTASAPIAPEVLDFLKICFCVPIQEAYGQTETCGAVTLTALEDTMSSSVGGPTPACEIKLQDIPEMNYTSKSRDADLTIAPCGEVCYRGPLLFSGYYKLPDKTAEAIDEDGWLHSGDVGKLLPNGAIRLIDRKKNIFKLAQGEYVAPEKIENLLVQLPEIAQVFVHGESLEAHLVAIVVPAEPQLVALAALQGNHSTFERLCGDAAITKQILDKVQSFSRSNGLLGFEIPKAILLIPTPFSIENDLLTPTMKLKRHDAKQRFTKEIAQLYAASRQ